MTKNGPPGTNIDPVILAHTDKLREQGTHWTAKAKEFDAFASRFKALEFTMADAGVLFQGIVAPYAGLLAAMTSLTSQASAAATAIDKTMHTVADVYDDEERRQVRRMKDFDPKLKDSR